MAAKLDAEIRSQMDVSFLHSTFFTDSQIVLGYIKNDHKRFKTFVENRVSIIRQLSEPSQWQHIEGISNPADVASRGCVAGDLPLTWVEGPNFLRTFRCDWPLFDGSITSIHEDVDDPELAKASVNTVVDEDNRVHPVDRLSEYFSSYYRMKKAVAILLRVKAKLKAKTAETGRVTSKEMREAEILIITHVQAISLISVS